MTRLTNWLQASLDCDFKREESIQSSALLIPFHSLLLRPSFSMATGTARITSFLTRVFYLSFLHFLTRDRENRTRFKQWPSQPFLLSFLSSLPFSFLNFRNSQTRLTNLAGSKLAGLGDPDRSILGHSHCFLASISPSLSVLFFRGNTHAITSFLTRPLYSLLPSSEAENRIGFQRWHEWPRNPSFPPSFFPPPPVFFLLCLSPISPAVLSSWISTVYLPHLT